MPNKTVEQYCVLCDADFEESDPRKEIKLVVSGHGNADINVRALAHPAHVDDQGMWDGKPFTYGGDVTV